MEALSVDGASGREAAFRVFAPEVSADAMLAERLLRADDAARLVDEPGRELVIETDSQVLVWAFRG